MVLTAAWGDEENFSGFVSEDAGISQNPSANIQPYQYSRVLLRGQEDLADSLSLILMGEADQQASGSSMFPSWLLYPVPNVLQLEVQNNGVDGQSFLLARLDRASLQWSSGSLETRVGLENFDWGSSSFYRPTDYFFPLSPLAWVSDTPLGSEGVDAKCFLFDDLSLEGAARLLQGGHAEEVVRLVNKGIGITLTPSFAWLQGRDGLGLEAAGTFPDFKAWVEGVDWFFPGGVDRLQWVAGLSTIKQGTTLKAEFFQDGTGEILGGFSNGTLDAAYLSGSVGRKFPGGWKTELSLVKSVDGGPFLFWPKIQWAFAPQWEAGFQAQILIASGAGPLDLYPGRTGLSGSFLF